jgi:succinate dehydrogenase/fumarate reductase cytochrome b subunit
LTGTGVILALFMIGHMFFVSSILLGKDAMVSVLVAKSEGELDESIYNGANIAQQVNC